MNREIAHITTVVTTTVLDTTGKWTYTGGAVPMADEVVVRQITYCGMDAAPYDMYVIQSNFGCIGSCISSGDFTVCPQTRIQLRSPIAGPLTFQLLYNGAPATEADLDTISITLDFIKYRSI